MESKKAYQQPTLLRHGAVEQVTLGRRGSGGDRQAMKPNPMMMMMGGTGDDED